MLPSHHVRCLTATACSPPLLQDVAAEAAFAMHSGVPGMDSTHLAAAATVANPAITAHRAALEQAFASYAAFGARDSAVVELDSFRCSKLVREAGLLGGPLTGQQLDVLFTRATRPDRSVRK